jgi:hypothetical protein
VKNHSALDRHRGGLRLSLDPHELDRRAQDNVHTDAGSAQEPSQSAASRASSELCDYGDTKKINVLIENHWGASSLDRAADQPDEGG